MTMRCKGPEYPRRREPSFERHGISSNRDLDERFPNQLGMLRYYLERHIQLDEEHHTPLARRMVAALCQSDPKKWQEAQEGARDALQARVALWDGVVEQIVLSRGA